MRFLPGLDSQHRFNGFKFWFVEIAEGFDFYETPCFVPVSSAKTVEYFKVWVGLLDHCQPMWSGFPVRARSTGHLLSNETVRTSNLAGSTRLTAMRRRARSLDPPSPVVD